MEEENVIEKVKALDDIAKKVIEENEKELKEISEKLIT